MPTLKIKLSKQSVAILEELASYLRHYTKRSRQPLRRPKADRYLPSIVSDSILHLPAQNHSARPSLKIQPKVILFRHE